MNEFRTVLDVNILCVWKRSTTCGVEAASRKGDVCVKMRRIDPSIARS